MDKKFQIFLSSTFRDLVKERQQALDIILNLHHIPAAMELFPAANASPLQVIRSAIDESDYYVLVIAGKYGTVDGEGVSYTENEYEYAFKRGKPILAFLVKHPEKLAAKDSELEGDGRDKLARFRKRVEANHLVRFWTTPANLLIEMQQALINEIREHPASGWVRAPSVAEVAMKPSAKDSGHPNVLEELLTESPFAGVLCHLYKQSGATPQISGLTKARYLDFLREAIAASSISYLTVQPSGLAWFKGADRFLQVFGDLTIPCTRILLVEDSSVITREQQNSDLCHWYLSRVGPNTRTYWLTRTDFRELLIWAKDTGKTTGEHEDIQNYKGADVVICDDKLCFQYNQESAEEGTLQFWHTRHGQASPYRWLVEALKEKPLPADRGFQELANVQLQTGFPGFKDSKGIRIDLNTITNNLAKLRFNLTPHCKIMAVLKGDAYGLGLQRIAQHLYRNRITDFAVSAITEAAVLRQAIATIAAGNAACRILLMEGVSRIDIGPALDNDLECIVWDQDTAREISREATARGQNARVHIKINTGMNRLGVAEVDFEAFLRRIREMSNISVVGIATHLAKAEEMDSELSMSQVESFQRCITIAKREMGNERVYIHIENSSAFMHTKEYQYDLVRIGGALYGVTSVDDSDRQKLALDNCVTVLGRVLQVRTLHAGQPVSYGGMQYTPDDSTTGQIAIVNVGYGDGVPFGYSSYQEARVLIRGIRCKVVGQVCLGMTCIDVSRVPNVLAGDDVVFVGSLGQELITPEMVAKWSRSHPYKVLCDFGTSLTRRYHPPLDRV